VASASSQTASTSPAEKVGQPQGKHHSPVQGFVLPSLLRCLIVSWSDQRAELLSAAAENTSWQTVVAKDIGQFLSHVFQLNVPLTIVDLPVSDDEGYEQIREAASRICDINDSLLVVCGATENSSEELWARQLGVWTYLPEAADLPGLELVFAEARKAIARRSSAYVESGAYHSRPDLPG